MDPSEEAHMLCDMGKHQLSLGRFDVAARTLRQAVELKPDHGPTRFELAKALAGERRWPEAFAELRIILDWAPKHPAALKLWFDALVAVDQCDEAIQWIGDHPAVLESKEMRVKVAALLYRLRRMDRFAELAKQMSARDLRRARELAIED